MITNNNFLSIDEIAVLSNKSVKFIRREISSGFLKSTKKNNKIFVKKNDYDIWKKNCDKNNVKIDNINWIDISNEMESIDGWKNNSQIRDFNFIDLFTGAGGLSCGLIMSGMMPVGSVEIIPQAVETYKYNFSKTKGFNGAVFNKDIREESVKKELINSVKDKHIHLISGGFPCQGFSISGNRVVTDPRNSLYLDMLDIVKKIQPDFVLMENVEGLRSMLNGKIEEKIIEDYNNIGYTINVTTLNSANYGVAQYRKRVIFIGNRIRAKNYHPKPFLNEDNFITVGDVLSQYLNTKEDTSINHTYAKSSPEMLKRLKEIPIGESLYKNYSNSWRKVDWNKPSCTVKENHGGVNIHPIENRVMTPRELATLQSFPKDFIFKGTKRWQLVQIGNAVPCLLGKAIGLAILKSYDDMKIIQSKKSH